MPSRDLTDVTLVSEDDEGPDDHNDSDDPVYHDDHADCDCDCDCDEDDDEDEDEDEDEEEENDAAMFFNPIVQSLCCFQTLPLPHSSNLRPLAASSLV